MTIVAAVLSILIAAVALGSALGKLQRNATIVESLHHVGVTDQQIPVLAGLEVLGGLAVLAGFGLAWLGVAGAVGLTLYFALAVASHLRVGDGPDRFTPALGLAVVAAAAAVTRAMAG